MTSINDFLLDEVLIIIFEYLTPPDRRICREVCLKWNEILIDQPQFRGDWKLNLTLPLNLNDIVILKNSETPFKTIVIDGDACKEVPRKVLKELFKHLGKTVEEMIATKFGSGFCNILKSFPLLRSLEIKDFVEFEPRYLLMPNLEHLKVDAFRWLNNNIEGLRKGCPQLKSIDYDKCNEFEVLHNVFNLFKKYPDLFKTIHWLEDESIYQNFRDGFLQIENSQIENFCFYSRTNFGFLLDVLKSHPGIKEIKVVVGRSTVIPPLELHPRITNFQAIIDESYNFTPFQTFSSLKILSIESSIDCPIGHQIISNASVKELYLTIRNCTCAQCWTSLSYSFLNVEHVNLTVTHMSVPSQDLPKLVQNWKKLEHLRFDSRNSWSNAPSIMGSFRGEKHPVLKHLHLTEDVSYYDDILSFVPALETLNYSLVPSVSFGKLPEYLKSLPELRRLIISTQPASPFPMEYSKLAEEQLQKFLSIVTERCRKLKVLKIPAVRQPRSGLVNKVKFLFKGLPKLKRVEFIKF